MKQLFNRQSVMMVFTGSKPVCRDVNLIKKLALTMVILFAGISFSFGQNTNSTKELLKEKKDITAKLRTNKMEAREEKESVKNLDNLPKQDVKDFARKFPDAKNAVWTATPDYYEVDFVSRGSKMMAFYDFNNQLIGRGKYIDYKSLPKNAIAKIQTKYKDYTVEKVIYYVDNRDNPDNMDIMGNPLEFDGYYTMLHNANSKEIVLRIARNSGDISEMSGSN